MGVCETVQVLAEAVALAKQPVEARYRLLIEILRLMPLYRDIRDLSAWESAFQAALAPCEDESEMGNVLAELFDFGRHNRYGAFDQAGTLFCYASFARWLTEHGVPAPDSPDLSRW